MLQDQVSSPATFDFSLGLVKLFLSPWNCKQCSEDVRHTCHLEYCSCFNRPWVELDKQEKCSASLADYSTTVIIVIPDLLARLGLLLGDINREVGQSLDWLWLASSDAVS